MTGSRRVFSLLVLFLLGITTVFAAGGRDENGLKPKDYDSNGWAKVSGIWVPSPAGAVYAEDSVNMEDLTVPTEEYHSETDEVVQDAYDKNGWRLLPGGSWEASPDGALFKGQEHRNLSFSITHVVNRMRNDEKGMLKALLLFGKNAEKEAGHILSSPEKLAEYGKDVTGEWVAARIDDAFTAGTGLMDWLTGHSFNYGKQLDLTINEHLINSLKVPKPKFSLNANTVEGAIERENWIVEALLDTFISNMTETERLDLITAINEEMKLEGNALGQEIVTAFSMGGLAGAWKIGGIKPYLMMSKMIKLFGDYVLGRTIPWVVYQTMATVAKRVFGVVLPIVGIVLALKTLYDIPGTINPREFDKFTPAVLLIGISRLSQQNDNALVIGKLK